MGKTIVFTSGKGGTGKTTAVAAVSSCLAALGSRVLCVDCDVGLGNLDLALGLAGTASTDLGDVILGGRPLSEAAQPHPEIPGLWFLAAPLALRAEDIPGDGMERVLQEAAAAFDFVLLDSSAGVGAGFELARCHADIAVLVSTWDATALRDGQKAVFLLYESGVSEVRLLANRVQPGVFRKTGFTLDDMIDAVGARLLGAVPEDPAVQQAVFRQMALALYGGTPASRAFLRAAKRLRGEDVPLGRI